MILSVLLTCLGNLLTTLEDWELLVDLVNNLNPPLSDRESSNPMNPAVSPPQQQRNNCITDRPMSVSVRDDQPMSDCVRGDSSDQDSVRTAISDQLISDCGSINQPKSTSTADDIDTRNECCGAVCGEELTQVTLLKLMLSSLPPLLVNKLLSGCHGNSFGGKTRGELHSLLSKLTSIHTQQRYYFANQAINFITFEVSIRTKREKMKKFSPSVIHHPIIQPSICCIRFVSELLLVSLNV